uniref:NR LBD domain-containing protein n=2 Tax=Bursaphelenchus xylophilus TaxID=6326 RepID=A0A1I7SJ03_BURXY
MTFKPITRPEHMRMERGTVSLIHSLLLDTTPAYSQLSREHKIILVKTFSSEFLCLHRSFVSAKVYKNQPRVIMHYGYYVDEECAKVFFEGSEKLDEHMKFARPIIRSMLITVRLLRDMDISETELMAMSMLMFYNG